MFDNRFAQYSSDGTRIMDRPLSAYLNEPSSLFFNEKIDGILRLQIYKFFVVHKIKILLDICYDNQYNNRVYI